MNFGEVLTRAWQIIWKHKVLWIFGILAGCGSSNLSNPANSSYRYSTQQRTPPGEMPPELQPFIDRLSQIEPWQIAIFAGIALFVGLAVVVLVILLSTIGQIGLIRGTLLAERGEEQMSFGELFNSSSQYFWRVFAVNLLIGIAGLLLFMVLGLPLIICTVGLGLLCLFPLLWFVQLIGEQSGIAIVVENQGVGAGIQRGWEVVSQNLGPMIVMALILYLGVSMLAGIVIALPFLFIIGPAALGLLLSTTTNIESALPGGLVMAGLCLVIYLPVFIVLNGILRSYISSAWTLTFMRLTQAPGVIDVLPVE